MTYTGYWITGIDQQCYIIYKLHKPVAAFFHLLQSADDIPPKFLLTAKPVTFIILIAGEVYLVTKKDSTSKKYNTHTQSFYGSSGFCPGLPGEPVSER